MESQLIKQGSLDLENDQPRKTTNLEGIMSNQHRNGSTSLSCINSPSFGMRIAQKPENPNPSTTTSAKSASLLKAKQIAEDIQRQYTSMMSLIGDLQKETGMAVKTQDLEKEYAKVFARVKVIGKL